MSKQLQQQIMDLLLSRRVRDGGFSQLSEPLYSTEATAWALTALHLIDPEINLEKDLKQLVSDQQPDGSFSLNGTNPDSIWCTSPALLAIATHSSFVDNANKASDFLLKVKMKQPHIATSTVIAHNFTLNGWPWISGTHSWIDPTAYAILALRKAGVVNHPRIDEAVQMILNRQLDAGGWNYGNTAVYGMPLRPLPENTATALCALQSKIQKEAILKSFEFLKSSLQNIRTPWTLAWGLLCFQAWEEPISTANDWISESLERRESLGGYTTSEIALLGIANLGWNAWMKPS